MRLRHALKLSMLLIALIGLLAVHGVGTTQGWNVVSSTTSKGLTVAGNNFNPAQITEKFNVNDVQAYVYAEINMTDTPRNATMWLLVRWIDPNGAVYRETSIGPGGGGLIWYMYDSIPISRSKPGMMPGPWSVKVYGDGDPFKKTLLFEQKFEIYSPTYTAEFMVSGLPLGTSVTGVLDEGTEFSINAGDSKSFSFPYMSNHTVKFDQIIAGSEKARYYLPASTMTFVTGGPYEINYITQYKLEVVSDLGETTGSGWYDKGATANFTVTALVADDPVLGFLGVKKKFAGWSGDSSAENNQAQINMNAPHTVKAVWKTDYTNLFLILGLAALAVATAAFTRRRRRSR